MTPAPDNRSPVAIAAMWASRIMTVSLEMVLPGVGGWWLDSRLGVTPLFTFVGFLLGVSMGMWHLIVMTRPDGQDADETSRRRAKSSEKDDVQERKQRP